MPQKYVLEHENVIVKYIALYDEYSYQCTNVRAFAIQ